MTNVYDLIEELYKSDENWEYYLQRRYAEDFIRRMAIGGAEDEELFSAWSQIVQLCIYCGNANIAIGDLNAEDLIDGIAWCGRNISEFNISYGKVQFFLETVDRLLQFLKTKNAVVNTYAAKDCREKLLGPNGELRIINPDGSFKKGFASYAFNRTVDLPVKVFVNMGVKMDKLLDDLKEYFQKPLYKKDIEHGRFLYYKLLPPPNGAAPNEEEQCFWDYFIFDYHLNKDGRTPLEAYRNYYEFLHQDSPSQENLEILDLLNTLLKTKFTLFTIEGYNSELELYTCKDFFTGKCSEIGVPVENAFDTTDTVFVGHLLPDNTMVTNYVRCLHLAKTARKRLLEAYKDLRAWYQVQNPRATDWTVFVEANPILILHLAAMYAGYFMLSAAISNPMDKPKYANYEPKTINLKCTEIKALAALVDSLNMPYRDKLLLLTLWSDFSRVSGVVNSPEAVYWAVACVYLYISLNKTYGFSMSAYAKTAQVSEESLLAKAEFIKKTLQIEDFDPRYVDEEGLFMLAMQ